MRAVIFILYGCMLVICTWLILARTDVQLAFQARRSLPGNHLLQDGDIAPAPWYKLGLFPNGPRPSDFSGRYLTGPLRQGEGIRRDETSAVPNFNFPTALVLAVPVPRELVDKGKIDAGLDISLIRVPSKRQGPLRKPDCAKIVAILCPSVERGQEGAPPSPTPPASSNTGEPSSSLNSAACIAFLATDDISRTNLVKYIGPSTAVSVDADGCQ
jgi:hypothetical protein